MPKEVEFYSDKDFPSELAENQNSVDVLICETTTKTKAIGWFDFKIMDWRIVANERIKRFKWRYFNPKINEY